MNQITQALQKLDVLDICTEKYFENRLEYIKCLTRKIELWEGHKKGAKDFAKDIVSNLEKQLSFLSKETKPDKELKELIFRITQKVIHVNLKYIEDPQEALRHIDS